MDNQYKIIPISEFPTVHDRARYSTYIWQDKVDNSIRYQRVYDEFNQQYLKFTLSDLEYINLLPSPDNPPYDDYIHQQQKYDGVLNRFFPEVLTSHRDEELRGLTTNTFSSAILPKTKLAEIEKVISDYGFDKHLGFFIHLICRIQHVYHREIEFYAQPDEVKRRKKLPEQVDKLVKVIKGHKELGLSKNSLKGRTTQIKFINGTGTITINDYGLILGIIDATREYWSYGDTKHWEKNLRHVAFNEEQMAKIDHFNKQLACVLYEFVTEARLIPLVGNKLSNPAALFVWQIMNLADIKTFDKNGIAHDININNKTDLSSLIKGYVRRHQVEKKPLFYDLQPNMEELKQFFEPEFIESVQLRVEPSVYDQAQSMCTKYQIPEITDEIALILNCLGYYNSMLGFQNYQTLKGKKNPELQSFLKFQEVAETDYNKLESISFKFTGDDEEHKMSDTSLKIILMEALRVHKHFNPEEFGADIWKTDFKTNAVEGSTEFIDGNRLNHPGERFLARFTAAFASYLESKGIVGGNQLEEQRNMFYIINYCLTVKQLIPSSASYVFFQKIKRWISLNKDLNS
jgi:hypothetical protein